MGCIGVGGAVTLINQEEIHLMAQSKDMEKRREAVNLLRSNFTNLPCHFRRKIPHFLRFKFPHPIIKFPLNCQIF